MIERAQEANPGAQVDWFVLPTGWRELPFASNALDAILASSVFEYLSDIPRVLSECHRTLRPGGVLIATVPNPKNLVRKLEKIFRPIVIAMSVTPLLKRIPKLESYATYLKCSQHRMAMDQWFSLGKEAQLLPLTPGDKEKQNSENNPPLVFILFRKSQ
jgi:SAM-dependent methyltransferase